MEIDQLTHRDKLVRDHQRLLDHNIVLMRRIKEVYEIKGYMEIGNYPEASEIVERLKRSGDFDTLWLAPTKGGMFTTEQIAIMKTAEFYEACKEPKYDHR